MSCEVYFAEMSHFPPFSPLHSSATSEWPSVCGRAYINTFMCVSVLTCVHECMWLCGSVALCPASPGCQHMVSGKVKLQTAAFSVALKDGVSLGGTLGMCVVQFV